MSPWQSNLWQLDWCCSHQYQTGVYYKDRGVIEHGNIIRDFDDKDIAVLQFHEVIGKPLAIVDSSKMKIGNEIMTIGFPYTLNSEKTLIVGNISAFENGLIKINTSVNNGNSGGPLLNMKGEMKFVRFFGVNWKITF